MSAARANVQEFSAKVSKSVAAVGVASALLASVRLAFSSAPRPDTRYRDGVTMATVRARANDDDAIAGGDDAWW